MANGPHCKAKPPGALTTRLKLETSYTPGPRRPTDMDACLLAKKLLTTKQWNAIDVDSRLHSSVGRYAVTRLNQLDPLDTAARFRYYGVLRKHRTCHCRHPLPFSSAADWHQPCTAPSVGKVKFRPDFSGADPCSGSSVEEMDSTSTRETNSLETKDGESQPLNKTAAHTHRNLVTPKENKS